MAIMPLTEESEFHVVHPNQDCRGWPVVDEGGRIVGRVQELMIDTERDRVTALRLEDGTHVAVERVALLDGSVVLEDLVVPVTATTLDPAAPRRTERWSELPVQRRKIPRGFTSFEDELRRHHLTVAADSGLTYEDMLPAYRHGYDLASGDRYLGRSWDGVATEVRAEWEARHPTPPWERAGVAIQGAWDRYRGSL
jgi:sporulation protein YlmC with PRC-barrel domain